VQDQEDKAFEDEAVKEEELSRVQQEIERLSQEQEVITRSQAVIQCAEAKRQHINRERVRLTELQYTIEIFCQHEQRVGASTQAAASPKQHQPTTPTSATYTDTTPPIPTTTNVRNPPIASTTIWHHRPKKNIDRSPTTSTTASVIPSRTTTQIP
jgi:TolA-binding protein